MTDVPARPIALTVQPEHIPAELKALPIWACWRYEWKTNKNGQGKWDKVPYTPYTTKNAASTRPSSWRSFTAAYNCYQERRDFFDGLFICLQESDPYTGGDFDHSTDLSRVPDTYAELSPSGAGVRFIGRGAIPSACKKPAGELYSKARFLSITGHKLPSAPCNIRPIQDALDVLYTELKGVDPKAVRDGKAGAGTRAEQAASIPAEEWEAGRALLRSGINRLLARLRSSAVSRKTHKDDTQLGLLLRENYADLAERWPTAGILRADGSLDSSQIRAVMASNIRVRGFTFPEYAALMSHFYGAECLAKWGNKQSFREELAALWLRGRTPRADEHQAAPVARAPRGRAGDHSALLERAYAVLQDFKAGIQAIAKTQELADALGVDRRTMISVLQELVETKRITYRRLGQYEGLVIEFSDVIYSDDKETDVIYSENGKGGLPHHNSTNGHYPKETITATEKVELPSPDVIYSHDDDELFGAPEPSETTSEPSGDTRDDFSPIDIEHRSYTNCVNPPNRSHLKNSTRNRISLREAVAAVFEELPRDRVVDTTTGEKKVWPVTIARVVAAVEAEHPGAWKRDAIEYWAKRTRAKRKSETFRELERLPAKDLNTKIRQVSSRVAHAERKAATADMPEIAEWYEKLATQAKNGLALLRWERDKRDQKEAERLETRGYTLVEQEEFLQLAAERSPRASPPARAAPDPPRQATGLIDRLKARKDEPHDS